MIINFPPNLILALSKKLITFSDFLDLDLANLGFLMKSHYNYLFVVTREGKALKFIGIEEQAKIVSSPRILFLR